MEIELVGFNGLGDCSLFKGDITNGGYIEIITPYHGLALLFFEKGQSYPVIIGEEPFKLEINSPDKPLFFAGSGENQFFYKLLSGKDSGTTQYAFPQLMIQAKQLLESTHSIHTIEELTAKKKEFHSFVHDNYQSLQHSDMVRRLISQYFMMHEYVDYHIEGAPASDIKIKYHKSIINGVGSWLDILKSHIPEHEILNYCVSLYYNRSMVTLASLIIDDFRDAAYCQGDVNETFSFPDNLLITDAKGSKERRLDEFKGNKIVAFVSDDCPVSMVETVDKARKIVEQKEDVTLILAPLQELSEKHLAMNGMVSGGKMLFINDENWRKENLAKKVKLPLFKMIGDTMSPDKPSSWETVQNQSRRPHRKSKRNSPVVLRSSGEPSLTDLNW